MTTNITIRMEKICKKDMWIIYNSFCLPKT